MEKTPSNHSISIEFLYFDGIWKLFLIRLSKILFWIQFHIVQNTKIYPIQLLEHDIGPNVFATTEKTVLNQPIRLITEL